MFCQPGQGPIPPDSDH